LERFTHFRLFCGVTVCLMFFGVLLPAAHAEDVTLAWDKPEGTVTGYNVYHGKMGTDFKSAPQIKVDQPSCEISGLEQGEMYGFMATSVDENGNESGFSEELYHNIPARGEGALDDEWTDNDEIDGAEGAEGATGGADGSTPPVKMDVTDLAATYFAVEVFDNGAFGTALLEVAFDGTGALTYKERRKSEGGDTAIGKTYTVDADGGLAIEGIDKGAVSPDGTYFVSGKMSSDESPLMLFGIKQEKGLKTADLKGDYTLCMFSSAPGAGTAAPVDATQTGSVSADGKGNFKKAAGKGFDATYTVDPDTGELLVTSAGGTFDQMNGALSEDGSIFAAVDTSSADDTLMFVIGIKAAANPAPADLTGSYFVNEFEYDETLQMPIGSLSKLSITGDGGYNLEQIANSCDCPPEESSGMLVPGESGEIQTVDDITQESASGGLSPNGEVFTAVKENAISVGILQATSKAPADVAAEDSGGGGGGGSCFIASLF